MAQNYTPAPPPSDALGDDLAAEILVAIRAEVERTMVRMGTVTSISGDHAQVSVQRLDEETGGQQFRARLAGTNFKPGQQVVLAPVPGGEYVVVGAIANSNAERAVISPAELEANSVQPRHLPDRSIGPVKLAEAYTTPGEANQISIAATNNIITGQQLVSNTHLESRIATRQPVGNYVTTGHTHQVNAIWNVPNNATLDTILRNVHAALVCIRNQRNSTSPTNQVCPTELANVGNLV